MADPQSEQLRASINTVVIAPVGLQDALLVFLHSAPELKLIACTATTQVLLALDLAQTPELILLEAPTSSDEAQTRVTQLKTAWPASHLIALVHHRNQVALVQAAGADEVLLSGVAPSLLMQVITRFSRAG